MTSLVHHLHAFVKDVELTEEEWAAAIGFLTRTGQTCDDVRQEFILLSDVLGVSMLVETINHRAGGTGTESTVLGPFHMVESPPRELGDDIALDGKGDAVPGARAGSPAPTASRSPGPSSTSGRPTTTASTTCSSPACSPSYNLRGLFTADDDGRFHFRTIEPRHYPIPDDGPVGELLAATGRHAYRPAHLHFIVSAPGYRPVTTHVFVAGSPYLDSDAVFGVKESLVREVVDGVLTFDVGLLRDDS